MSYSPDQLATYAFSSGEVSLADSASIQSPWIDMESADKYQFEATSPGGTFGLVIESSSNPAGSGATIDTDNEIVSAFHLFNVIPRQRYIRFTWENRTGSLANASLAIKLTYGSSDKLSVFPLGVVPSDFSQAGLVRSVTTGQQPDGDYVNSRQDGSAFTDTTPLAASGVYTSPWIDSDGWSSIRLFITTDVVSDDYGIVIEFSDDVGAGVPSVVSSKRYWMDGNDIARGYFQINFPPILDGFRVIYTNGPTIQTSFFLDATMRTSSDNLSYNQAGALNTTDFLTEVALGEIPNYEVGTKFGRNPDVDPGAGEDVWNGGGTYTGHPTSFTPELVQVRSSNSNDSSAGTGARTIRIGGLRSSSSPRYQTEDIVLNGTSYVSSVNTWWRVNSIRVLTGGSAGSNQGTITVRPVTTTAAVFASVPVGFNRSTIAAWTAPASRRTIIKRIRVSIIRSTGSQGSATITMRVRPPGGVYESVRVFEIQTGSGLNIELLGGIPVAPGSDIKFRADDVSDTNTVVESVMEYVILG